MMEKKEVGIGILGLGHVGRGTLDIIEKNNNFIAKKAYPHKIKLVGLADLDINRRPRSKKYEDIFTTSAQQVIDHPESQIIVEAIGGEFPAYDLIKKALNMGRHVVTPNKEVIAKHGYELLEVARKNQVQLLFETSVGSAIPVLGVISNILTSCPLDEIGGILNGTTNYILDLMFENGITQQEALRKAQEMGFAEADPSKDILGLDALYKIFILSSLGFQTRLDLNQINYRGIADITHEDIQLAKQLGYRIKLLAMAKKKKGGIGIQVQPELIDQGHLLTHIHGADNGIMLYGESYGRLFFSGAGAGGIAGGSMIVSDIVRIIRQPNYFEFDELVENPYYTKIQTFEREEQNNFLRIQVEKEHDYRARIVEFFVKEDISVEGFSEMMTEEDKIAFGILTSWTKKEKMNKALIGLDKQINGAKIMNCMSVYKNDRQ